MTPSTLDYAPAEIPAGKEFTTAEPKRELIEDVVKNQIVVDGIDFDQNYLPAGLSYPEVPQKYDTLDDIIEGFVAVSAPGVSFFRHVSSHNANVAWVRITNIPEQEDKVVSVVVDRWHNNVRVLFTEGVNLDPSKDRADFLEGLISSYPNYFFIVEAADLPDFFDILDNYTDSEEDLVRLDKYGVNRSEDNFWDVYDWFQEAFNKHQGKERGIVDLNRYYNYAADKYRIRLEAWRVVREVVYIFSGRELCTKMHRNIHDVFNENGVQIMSPAYKNDPAELKVVPKKRWYMLPATEPGYVFEA